MPYFKNEKGAREHVNDKEVMTHLEKAGFTKLKGKELFLCIVVKACKEWGIPMLVAWTIFYLTDDFASSIILLFVTQQMLN